MYSRLRCTQGRRKPPIFFPTLSCFSKSSSCSRVSRVAPCSFQQCFSTSAGTERPALAAQQGTRGLSAERSAARHHLQVLRLHLLDLAQAPAHLAVHARFAKIELLHPSPRSSSAFSSAPSPRRRSPPSSRPRRRRSPRTRRARCPPQKRRSSANRRWSSRSRAEPRAGEPRAEPRRRRSSRRQPASSSPARRLPPSPWRRARSTAWPCRCAGSDSPREPSTTIRRPAELSMSPPHERQLRCVRGFHHRARHAGTLQGGRRHSGVGRGDETGDASAFASGSALLGGRGRALRAHRTSRRRLPSDKAAISAASGRPRRARRPPSPRRSHASPSAQPRPRRRSARAARPRAAVGSAAATGAEGAACAVRFDRCAPTSLASWSTPRSPGSGTEAERAQPGVKARCEPFATGGAGAVRLRGRPGTSPILTVSARSDSDSRFHRRPPALTASDLWLRLTARFGRCREKLWWTKPNRRDRRGDPVRSFRGKEVGAIARSVVK